MTMLARTRYGVIQLLTDISGGGFRLSDAPCKKGLQQLRGRDLRYKTEPRSRWSRA
jgi:hypothetical protein